MTRRNSHRPPSGAHPLTAALVFRQTIRAHGGVERGMLEAVLEDVNPDLLLEAQAAFGVRELLERAKKLIARADRALREAAPEQRRRLVGFSPAMLALAADQAFQLDHMQERFSRATEDRARAEATLEHALTHALTQIDQASRVLKKVYVVSDALRATFDVDPVSLAGPNRFEAAAHALGRLANAGKYILREGGMSARHRATLYGLDGRYLEGLADSGTRLLDLDAEIGAAEQILAERASLNRVHAVTAYLFQSIADAFDAAHRLDPTAPLFILTPEESMRPRLRREDNEVSQVSLRADAVVARPAAPPAPQLAPVRHLARISVTRR